MGHFSSVPIVLIKDIAYLADKKEVYMSPFSFLQQCHAPDC